MIFRVLYVKFWAIIPRTLLAFLQLSLTWWSHLRSLEIMIPRSRCRLTVVIWLPSIAYWWLRLWLPNCMTVHFEVLQGIIHLSDHSANLFISYWSCSSSSCCSCCCCNTRRLRMILSSAWALVGDWVSSAMLLPNDCIFLSIPTAGHAIHRCWAVPSSSPHNLQNGSSSSPIMVLHDLSLGWCHDLNLMRFTLSSQLILPSSSFLILSGSLFSTLRVLTAYFSLTSFLMTALLVLWSSGTSACWRVVHSFALSSACSLPSRPQWDGTQSTMSSLPPSSASLSSPLRVSSLWWEVSPPRASTSDLLSVTMWPIAVLGPLQPGGRFEHSCQLGGIWRASCSRWHPPLLNSLVPGPHDNSGTSPPPPRAIHHLSTTLPSAYTASLAFSSCISSGSFFETSIVLRTLMGLPRLHGVGAHPLGWLHPLPSLPDCPSVPILLCFCAFTSFSLCAVARLPRPPLSSGLLGHHSPQVSLW